MRVDIRKLDHARVAIDDAITELCLRANSTRFEAMVGLIEELGFDIKVLEHEGWYFASAWTTSERDRATRIYYRRGSRGATLYETRVLRQRLCIAYTFEDALLALLCRLVDEKVDLRLAVVEPTEHFVAIGSPTRDDPLREWIEGEWSDVDFHFGPDGLRQELARHPG